jgi:hypothetical protein
LTAFYQYYETRCPEGNLHELEGIQCKKCKYETRFFVERNADYFNKHYEKFVKIQKKKQDIAQQQLIEVQQLIARRHSKEGLKLPNYEYNLKNLSEWVQISAVKYNILLNLGLGEGIKQSEISAGKINPARDETDEIAKMRAVKLRGYLYKFVREYNFYINTEDVKKYSVDLQKMHGDHFTAKKAKEFLPTIETAGQLIDDYSVYLKPKLFSNYLLESIGAYMIQIYKAAPEKQRESAAALIKYFTNSIIARDTMMSPPEVRIFKKDGDESSESESSAGSDEFSSMSTTTTSDQSSSSSSSADEAADIVYTRENYDLEDEMDYDDD